MSNLSERESRRKSVIGDFVAGQGSEPVTGSRRGRPKEDREIKKRVSLSVVPSLYEDVQKIAYVQRRSMSDIVGELLEQYREEQKPALDEYKQLKCNKKF